MSITGTRLCLADALAMAKDIGRQIDGEAYAVGSVRRKKPEVGDIEILVHQDAEIMLDVGAGPLLPGEYESIKGGPGKRDDWKYWQLKHVASDVNIDLFRFDNANRGSMMLIRTGPREFSQGFVMALKRQGLRHMDGYIRSLHGGPSFIPCPDERKAFKFAAMTYIVPEKRR